MSRQNPPKPVRPRVVGTISPHKTVQLIAKNTEYSRGGPDYPKLGYWRVATPSGYPFELRLWVFGVGETAPAHSRNPNEFFTYFYRRYVGRRPPDRDWGPFYDDERFTDSVLEVWYEGYLVGLVTGVEGPGEGSADLYIAGPGLGVDLGLPLALQLEGMFRGGVSAIVTSLSPGAVKLVEKSGLGHLISHGHLYGTVEDIRPFLAPALGPQ